MLRSGHSAEGKVQREKILGRTLPRSHQALRLGTENRPTQLEEDYMENENKMQRKEPVYKASRPTGFTCGRCGVVERDPLFCPSCFRCEKCCTCIKDKE
jgi:hypothetical protein